MESSFYKANKALGSAAEYSILLRFIMELVKLVVKSVVKSPLSGLNKGKMVRIPLPLLNLCKGRYLLVSSGFSFIYGIF